MKIAKIEMAKILYISYNGALEPISQSQIIPYLLGLSKRGFKFTFLSFEKRSELKNKKDVEKLDYELKASQIEWHRLTYHKKPLIISTVYDIFMGIIYCNYLIFKDRIAIIHARSYVPAVIAYILSKCFKKKFIFDMRGMMLDEYVDAGIFKNRGLIYKLGKKIERKLLLSATIIVVLTERIKKIIEDFDYLQNKRGRQLNVIPCCVDLQEFLYHIDKKAVRKELNLINNFIFVYIGSVGTWYFLEGMLDLFMVAKKKIPNVHFLFLGRGNKFEIEKAILNKNLNLINFTIMETQHDRVSDYISECDAGIIFYKQTFSRLACSPVKFGEYLACGIPLILNIGIGDTEEIVVNNNIGAVVNEFNEKCYEKAIDRLLELKKDEASLRQRCRSVAERFLALEYGIEKYWRIYKDIGHN